MKIGIPRAMYYYIEPKWLDFFNYLNVPIIISKKTNNEIIRNGINIANDELCLSMKIFMGHVNSLKGKCDYLFLPRIDNYGLYEQMCPNYSGLYEIVKNQFEFDILDCNIDYKNKKDEYKAFLEIGKKLNFNYKIIKKAYKYSTIINNKRIKKNHIISYNKLKSDRPKILVVSHPYNVFDEYIGKPIIDYLDKECEVIISSNFDNRITNKLSDEICEDLYFKCSRDNVGSISLCLPYIDGILFITTFPCGLDSLVNEIIMRRIKKPYLNLVIDELNDNTGFETRLESFVDIIRGIKNV